MGYTDHFGLMRFAEDEALGDRLAEALKIGGGTLAVSWLNLGEYATVTSSETRLQAERLLERIVPAVFPSTSMPGRFRSANSPAGLIPTLMPPSPSYSCGAGRRSQRRD
jgi:hypothetical protein